MCRFAKIEKRAKSLHPSVHVKKHPVPDLVLMAKNHKNDKVLSNTVHIIYLYVYSKNPPGWIRRFSWGNKNSWKKVLTYFRGHPGPDIIIRNLFLI